MNIAARPILAERLQVKGDRMSIFKFRQEKKKKRVWGIVAGILAAILTGIAVFLPFAHEEASESEPNPDEPTEQEPDSPVSSRLRIPESSSSWTSTKLETVRPRIVSSAWIRATQSLFSPRFVETLRDIARDVREEPIDRHTRIEAATSDVIEAEPTEKGRATKRPD